MADEQRVLNKSSGLEDGEFYLGDILGQPPQKPQTSQSEEFYLDDPSQPVKPAFDIPAIPDEHRVTGIQMLSDSVYEGFTKIATRVAGGAVGATANLNDFLGFITGLNAFKKYRETFVEPQRQAAQMAQAVSPPENLAEKTVFDLAGSLGDLAVSLPIDMATGVATKTALVGRILPKMEAILSRIPDFAIGSGWRGMVEGIEQSDNLFTAVPKGVIQGAENAAIGTLYASAGTGLRGIGKMAALGAASAIYNASQEGRPPTTDELVEGMAHGTAFGIVFTALEHITEATRNQQEKVVLREYSKQIGEVLDKRIKDPARIPEIMDDMLRDERIRLPIREGLAQPFLDLLERRGALVAPDLTVGSWKDASTLSMLRETTERNIEGVAKADALKVKEFTTERIKENETMGARWETATRQILRGQMQKWGIKPGSLDDKLIQRYGEGNATLADIQAASPKNWENVIEAANWFRGKYDTLLTTINEVRGKYDYGPILKREDYFRHIQELTTASDVFGFLLGGKNPPTAIAGVVQKAKPGKPFTPVEMKRLGGKYVESAIGGFDNYLRVTKNQIFHTDSVQRMRMLENYIRTQAESNDKIDLSNFMTNIVDYTNLLAGQPHTFDTAIQRSFGRPAYAVLHWLTRKTSANMMAGNISAALTNNIVLLVQGPATVNKMSLLKGVFTSVMTPFHEYALKIDGIESELFARRYPDKKIALNFWDSASDKASAFFTAVDQFSVKALIAGKYYEGREQGLTPEDAMKTADNYTSRAVQDRSKGQLPLLMESKALGVATQFQVEVNNMVSFLQKDIPQMYHGDIKRTASALAQVAVYSWVFNNLFEELAGRRPTIDPIYMVATLMGINKSGRGRPFTERLAPAAKEMVGSLPFGNLFVEGGRFPVSSGFPDLWKLADNPTLNETWKQMSRPLFYLMPKFGGAQVKKVLDGMYDYARGRSETPSGDERYIVHRDIRNFLQGFLFGKNAFPEAVKYFSLPEDER